MTALKRRLAEMRQSGRRITLRALAGKIGCSYGWLCDIANGKGVPSLKLAMRLSEEIGLPVEAFGQERS